MKREEQQRLRRIERAREALSKLSREEIHALMHEQNACACAQAAKFVAASPAAAIGGVAGAIFGLLVSNKPLLSDKLGVKKGV